ncbi:PspC family transcriptional regulator [Limibacter armeniacum]|uniref:PspC domain-containing protein n=1 Tax=Limibacter armeniacum TaxID=466084 RepID=UPI002FE50664
MKQWQYFIEKQAFGVCSKIGEKLGIATSVIRMYFIYASFLTFGSPLVLYLAIAFWMNVRNYVRRGKACRETSL